MKAPEKIWRSRYDKQWSFADCTMTRCDEQQAYIRADVAQAMVAAAYEDAADRCQTLSYGWEDDEGVYVYPSAEFCADHLRSNIPTDARAALAARDKRVREEALREAAAVCENVRIQKANGPMPEGSCFDYEQRILALASEDQTNG